MKEAVMECPFPVRYNTEVRGMALILTFVNIAGCLYLWRSSDFYPEQYEWLLILLLVVSSVMHGVGAFGNRRKLRQVGLVLSAIGIVALGGALLCTWIVYGVGAVVVALAIIAVLVRDVWGKPREECIDR